MLNAARGQSRAAQATWASPVHEARPRIATAIAAAAQAASASPAKSIRASTVPRRLARCVLSCGALLGASFASLTERGGAWVAVELSIRAKTGCGVGQGFWALRSENESDFARPLVGFGSNGRKVE